VKRISVLQQFVELHSGFLFAGQKNVCEFLYQSTRQTNDISSELAM